MGPRNVSESMMSWSEAERCLLLTVNLLLSSSAQRSRACGEEEGRREGGEKGVEAPLIIVNLNLSSTEQQTASANYRDEYN